ncbi:WD repeat-containing protein, putative [Plasmodium berghei]|uniref:WD repeat-containing protein, putative n=1 Tax=Plasmodium berghei TaxID=5821 RepID=A0A1D3Q4N7_PLABE|nr:WD repeat-containing protein, putative [Plasmodium berghei]
MNSIKRICGNHGVKCIQFLNPNLVCISFGNIIKIINIINKDILLEYAVSNSSNIYGLIYKKCEENKELKGHRGIIFKVKFFKKSKYLGSTSDDREGIIWSKINKDGNDKIIKKEYNEEISEMNDNDNNNILLNKSNNLLFYYKIDKILTGHDARIWDIEMCKYKNNIYFVTCSEDSTCIIYEIKDRIKENDINNKSVCRQNGFSFKYSSACSGSIRFILFNPSYKILLSGFDNGSVHLISIYKLIKNNFKINCIKNNQVNKENKSEYIFENNSNLYYYDEQILKKKNMINFLDDSLNKELDKTNDWIRSINHINMTNIIICTNFGKIYILKTNKINNRLVLLHKIEDKNCLLTCLTFYGLNYICLGFSNGFSSFLFLSNLKDNNHPNIIFSKNFNCFSHRVSDMNLIPLSTLSYKQIISFIENKNLGNILYLNLKKDTLSNTKQNILDSNTTIYASTDDFTFYKVIYNTEMETDVEISKVEPFVSSFLLATFDHTGNIKFFGVQNEDGKINFIEISETLIDVKNQKSKIISFNYALREKHTKQGSQISLNILIFLGDEYGCIFIIYLKIPIQIKDKKRIYDFKNLTIKHKDKIRIHSNRKVFDIKIIDGFIYSCGQNGNIIKYQLYKNKIYTLYKLCLIKIPYYSSIYKLIPIFINTKKDVASEPVSRCGKRGTTSEPANDATYSQEDNIHNIIVCCFKEKKFVLYDLKNKIEYISIECGGFRRPLSIFMKYTNNLVNTFSFCFCKEKNIFFYFKELNQNKSNIIPYHQIYINSDFHTKTISSILWINKNYFITCSEDGTIKILFSKPIRQNQESKSYIFDPKKNIKKKYNSKNYILNRIEVVQNIYNHNEPIFSMCFLKNPFYKFRNLRFLASVGAKNSINLFYIFMNNNNIPIIYHIEKLKVPIFSSNLRFLCVEGSYKISEYTENSYVINFDIFIGTSIGHIFRYNNGIYKFVIYKNIVFSKVQKHANLTNSYNLHSTILSINFINIFKNKISKNINNESNIEMCNHIPHDMVHKSDLNELCFFIKKKKYIKMDNKEIHNILVCGLNNGNVYIYHIEENKMNLLKKVKVHQNGINQIAIKKKNNRIIHIFTCGDDQSVNILSIKIKDKIKQLEIKKNENSNNHINQTISNNFNIQKRFKICILQNTNFPNSHYSSIRAIVNFSNYIITTSWDQYISIWKINGCSANKNSDRNIDKNIIILSIFKKFKMAVYDVSCLSYLPIKKKKHIFKNCENKLKHLEIHNLETNRKYYNCKMYLSVGGTNGSIECFSLNLTK